MVQVLLQLGHVMNEVMDLPICCKSEFSHHSVEVIHFELDPLEALPQDEAQVGVVLGDLNRLVDHLSSLNLHSEEVLGLYIR